MLQISLNAFSRFDGDEIDPDRLLRLVGTRTTTDRFGFLLRPYWTPATDLLYKNTIRRVTATGDEHCERFRRLLCPVKIDAEKFTWRESRDGFDPELCEYDRVKQTLRVLPPNDRDQNERDAAFFRLSILVPPLPIPAGFRWHVDYGEARLDFLLESVRRIKGMTVLFIRRQGRLDGSSVVIRQGITAYALERSVVLEDRTLDTVREKDSDDGHSTRIWTESRLVRSSLSNSTVEQLAPQFLKYRTPAGNRYLYDCGTGRILSTDAKTYDIIDRYGIRPEREILENTEPDERIEVRSSLADLGRLRKDGYLVPHEPTEPDRVEIVRHGTSYSTPADFWMKYGALLVLGLTERCNLDCVYCCYSGKFEGHRSHGNRIMSLDIAKKAIRQLLDQEPARQGRYPITFYGGEPLLEFDLLRECVRFAKEDAARRGKRVRFSITTNGTLLDDKVADFLVEHDFLILVSLDGCRETHDRYRVFPNGKGSFDLVERNLLRFRDKYPKYLKRGINVTLAPPLALEKTAELIDALAPYYPIIRASLVNPGYDYRFEEELRTRYGCSNCSSCETDSMSAGDGFKLFRGKDAAELRKMWDLVVESTTRHGLAATRDTMPLAAALFGPQLSLLHKRPVTKRPQEWTFFVPCLPGYTRRYCDAGGTYRICERVDNSDAFVVGDVENGLDPARLERIMEMRRHFGDCGNCTALKTCDICYARMPKCDDAESGYDPRFDLLCRQTRRRHEQLLPVYTTVMERNAEAFELPPSGETLPPSIPLRFGSPGSRLGEATRKMLELERLPDTDIMREPVGNDLIRIS